MANTFKSTTEPSAEYSNATTPQAPEKVADKQGGLLAKGKRKILELTQKKENNEPEAALQDQHTISPISNPTLLPSPSPTTLTGEQRPSPRGSPRIFPATLGASPNRWANRSTSPGLHSPASSLIFERNVQEPELSPAIPAHIQTEDHIPAALDASSIAITDTRLNPDEVEIVMHSAHQPAAAAVAGSTTDSIYAPSQPMEDSSVLSHSEVGDSVHNSTYGSLDNTDVKRLSFISFADVVQAEHAETDREGGQFSSLSHAANLPSPVSSTAPSRALSVSPPVSGNVSEGKGVRVPGSPTSHNAPLLGSDLQIETMRQVIRKTESRDLSGVRQQPAGISTLTEA